MPPQRVASIGALAVSCSKILSFSAPNVASLGYCQQACSEKSNLSFNVMVRRIALTLQSVLAQQ